MHLSAKKCRSVTDRICRFGAPPDKAGCGSCGAPQSWTSPAKLAVSGSSALARPGQADQVLPGFIIRVICRNMSSGAIRLIVFSTLARPGRISSFPRSMPSIAPRARASTAMLCVPSSSASNSARINRVSTGGGASSNTRTPQPPAARATRARRPAAAPPRARPWPWP